MVQCRMVRLVLLSPCHGWRNFMVKKIHSVGGYICHQIHIIKRVQQPNKREYLISVNTAIYIVNQSVQFLHSGGGQ